MFKTFAVHLSKGSMNGDRGLRTGSQTVSMGIPYNTRAIKRLATLFDGLRGALNPTTVLITHSANTALKMVKHMIHTNTLVGWTRQCSVKMKDREPSRKKNEMMESGKTATSPLKKLRFTIFVSPICARALRDALRIISANSGSWATYNSLTRIRSIR